MSSVVTNLLLQASSRLASTRPGQVCDLQGINILGIEGWYKYVPTKSVPSVGCQVDFAPLNIGTFWLVLAGLADILLRVGTFVAVFYFLWGALKMITSQGSPEGINNARSTMTNALVGLVICIVSAQILSFVMNMILGARF